MRLKSLLVVILGILCVSTSFAQPNPKDVLVDGDPPLTQQMSSDYMRFMQWALRTPLTIAQQNRIQDFLVDSWKSSNHPEIERTLNILALRSRIEAMGLKDSQWAAFQTGQDALDNWNSNNSLEMARWGLALFNSSHKPLVVGNPPLTKQMEDAYEETGYFILEAVDGSKPQPLDAMERNQLADSLGGTFTQLPDDQKANFASLPKTWVQLRTAWPTLDESTKSSLAAAWRAAMHPATKPATGSKKGSKPAPAPPKPSNEPTINRLVGMIWMLRPDIFSKMSGVGTPYGMGW